MNKDYNHFMPVRVVSGRSCVTEFSFKDFGKRCFIVTGKNSAKLSGALDDFEKTLNKDGIEYKIFDRIENNPRLVTCFEAGKEANDFGADFIIGIGGGSPMDAAKAIAVFADNPCLEMMDIFKLHFKSAKPIILCGTTAGTGSEVTQVSVLNIPDGDHESKKSLKSPFIYASLVLSDVKYTEKLPMDVTVSTALDSVCHAIEAYFHKNAGRFERMFALDTVRTVWPVLIKVSEGGNIDSNMREELLFGSLLGGLSINNCGTCFPHSMGYALTTRHGLPHGFACASFIADFLEYHSKDYPDNVKLFLDIMRFNNTEEFGAAIDKMLPHNIVLSEDMAAEYAKRADSLPNHRISLCEGDYALAQRLYKKHFVK